MLKSRNILLTLPGYAIIELLAVKPTVYLCLCSAGQFLLAGKSQSFVSTHRVGFSMHNFVDLKEMINNYIRKIILSIVQFT